MKIELGNHYRPKDAKLKDLTRIVLAYDEETQIATMQTDKGGFRREYNIKRLLQTHKFAGHELLSADVLLKYEIAYKEQCIKKEQVLIEFAETKLKAKKKELAMLKDKHIKVKNRCDSCLGSSMILPKCDKCEYNNYREIQ